MAREIRDEVEPLPMIRNFIDIAILAGIAYFCVLLYHERSAIAVLQRELAPRQAIVGEFKVVDSTKIYVKGLPTESPLDFAWRIYLPKGYAPGEFLGLGDGKFPSVRTGSSLKEPVDVVVRASLRQYDQTYSLQIYGGVAALDVVKPAKDLPNVQSILQLLDPQVATIRQLARERTLELGTDEEFSLLKVSLNATDDSPVERDFAVYRMFPLSKTPPIKSPLTSQSSNGQ